MISYLPMQDTNGNVIALADNTGKLIEKVNYSSYGAPTFIYDHVAPQVDQVRIISGKINIRFSEAVNQTSAKSAIKLKQGTNDLTGAITFTEEDKLAVFAPSSTLPNASLTITITTDLEDKNTNKLAAEFSQGFTYAGSDLIVFDRVAPEVETIKFVDGKISVVFSEELDPASITSAIGLTYATGTINGTSTLENSKTILFTLGNTLSNNIEYTVVVKSSIKDLSGKSLVQFSEKFIYSGSDLLIYQKPNPSEHAESFVKNTTLFQGRSFDTETGLYYFRARYLHPELGRLLQADPKGFSDSFNPYQSFGNNPVNFSDPMGEELYIFGSNGSSVSVYKDKRDFLQRLLSSQITRTNFMNQSRPISEVEGPISDLRVKSRTKGKRITFTDRVGGEKKGYNATASAMNSFGNGMIEYDTFDARTIPSFPEKTATIANGEYIGVFKLHQGKYPAIQLHVKLRKRIGSIEIPVIRNPQYDKNNNYRQQLYPFGDVEYDVNGPDPMRLVKKYQSSFSLTPPRVYGYAIGINLHHSGDKDEVIGNENSERPYSTGCPIIRTSQWTQFMDIVGLQKKETADVIINTTANKR